MKPNFQKYLTRKYSVLMNDIIIQSWLDSRRFYKLSGVKEYVNNLEVINGDFCFDMNWMENVIKKYAYKKLDFFWNFCEKGYWHGEELINFVRNLKLEKNEENLKKMFIKSLNLAKNLIVFVPQTHPLAEIIENDVRDILKQKNLRGKNFEETLIALTQPKKLNTPILEQIELQKIKASLKNPNFNLNKTLNKHMIKFAFLGYREPFAKGFNLDFFKKRLETDEHFVKNSEIIKIKFNNQEKQKIELMKELV